MWVSGSFDIWTQNTAPMRILMFILFESERLYYWTIFKSCICYIFTLDKSKKNNCLDIVSSKAISKLSYYWKENQNSGKTFSIAKIAEH